MDEQRSSNTIDAAISAVKTEIIDLHRLLDAADRRYEQRFELQEKAITVALTSQEKAVLAALASVREQTKDRFESSEKAIVKAEDKQNAYNTAHNDLVRKMDDQSKATMPRTENESRFKAMEDKINDMRDTLHISHGKEMVSDPMIGQMLIELKALRTDQTLSRGTGIGIEKVIGLVVGSGGLAAFIGYLAAHFVK